MMLPKKKQNRFQLSFKAKEIPVYMPMEEFLMDNLDIPTRSDTSVSYTHLTLPTKRIV